MSEPASTLPTTFESEPPREPAIWVIRPRQPRWWVYALFLFLTLLTTTIVGARMEANFLRHLSVFSLRDDTLSLFPIEWIAQHPANLMLGLPFSLTLMFILFAHEMGHYLYARYYRVSVTPPLFVPCPYLSLFGTLGAFIRIKSPIPSRLALFDIGVAGPIAGFVPACAAMLYGLSMSYPIIGPTADDIKLGYPLTFGLAARLLHVTQPLSSLSLHPVAAAAWVGMFATALNLLPVGQLDGGHIVFSVAPRFHRWVSVVAVVALIPLGKYAWAGWLLWALLLTLTLRHPRVPLYPKISPGRILVALCAAIILVLSFTPAPIAESSGRQSWPRIRDGVEHTLHDASEGISHAINRR